MHAVVSLSAADLVLVMNVAMPRLGLDPRGYRRLRSTLRKRLSRRMADVGARTARQYLARLQGDARELRAFDALCRMSISRFYRDGCVFELLGSVHLPRLAAEARAAGRPRVAAWSAGCASGEEAYSLAMSWHFEVEPGFRELQFDVLASDADERLLERARSALYAAATLRELPSDWRERAFDVESSRLRLRQPLRDMVQLERRDLRASVPETSFDVVLCRNSVFTYFDGSLQQRFAEQLWSLLPAGGVLVIGGRECLPAAVRGAWATQSPGVFLKPH